MDRIESESFRLGCPEFADVFVGCEAFEGLEAPRAEYVGRFRGDPGLAGWVRIHPFANGNGRTARLWANYIAMRYGLPPFVSLRPRPDDGYTDAAEKAMEGRWQPTAEVFREMFREALRR